jgi:hypothetical protein
MGWNTSALFIQAPRQVVIDELAAFSKPTGRELHYTEATLAELAPEQALAEVDGWTELWDPGCEVSLSPDQDELRRALSRKGRMLVVLWSSVVSMYGFWLYDGGALVRAVRYDHGDAVYQEGEPLPEEADIVLPSWGMDEDWAFTILERITKITNLSRNSTPYHVLAP